MRRALALVWLFVSLSLVAAGQAYTTVTATNVLVDNGSGTAVNPPTSSQLCFNGVNSSGATVTYTPSGGSPTTGPVCGTLNGTGGLTGSLQVANPATAAPLGLLYTITVVNGSTTYLTIPTVSLSGTIFNFDGFSVPGTSSANGIGKAHLACASGAQWASTTLPPGQNNQRCNTSGLWDSYPPANYCPAGMAYLVPQQGGTPICQAPTLEGNGAPSGSCFEKSTYLDVTGGGFYACTNGAWSLKSSSSPGVTSINGAAGTFVLSGAGFGGCSTSGGTTTCTINGGGSSLPSTHQLIAGNGSGGAVATAMDDGQTTAGQITSTEPVNDTSASNSVPAGADMNSGSSTSYIIGRQITCPNVAIATVSGCVLNIGLGGALVNGANLSIRFRNFGSSTTNRGSLALSSNSTNTPAFEWDWAGDSFFPQLASIPCLGTDSSGKLGAGSGCASSGGTVTSVGLNLPSSVFSVSGSPVTSSGNLGASFINQAANQFFAGPSTGAPATPAFRAIVPADLPLGSSSQAGALQCGSGTSCSGGVITASGGGGTSLISRVSCVTYGCVADGNVGANTGTDNTTPFTNCLTAAITAKAYCYVPAGVYRIATSLPTVNTSGTGFVGDIWSTSTSSGPSTTIFTSSASATILTISSGGLSFLTGNALIGISLQAGVTRNTGSIALLMDHAAEAYIHHNHFVDSAIGLDITNSPSYGIGMIEHNEADFGIVTACGAGPFIGFNLHGSSGGFTSLLIQSNNVYNNCGSTPTSYGYKGDGALVDLNMVNNFSDSTSYGVYMVGTSGLDVHIIDQTNDANTVQCEHFDFGGSGALSELRGGFCDTHFGSSGGTELHNVVGMRVSNRQYYDSGGTLPQGILINTGSTGNSITGNTFYQPNSIGIVCNAANKNSMSGNTFNLTGAASLAFQFTNCSDWSISGNNGLNGSSTVISLDASSNNNKTVNVGNSWTSSGTAISDAGTGNQIPVGTTSNALTMNNGGAGAASGSTFDGSAAKTISYNTIGAPGVSGTPTSGHCAQWGASNTLGDSGAACGGGGGSGNYINLCASVTLTNATCSSGLITLSGTATSVLISAIPGTYLNLELVTNFADSASGQDALFRFGTGGGAVDTGANYDWSNIYTPAGTAPSSSTQNLQTSAHLCALPHASSAAGGCKVVIPMYAQTTSWKNATAATSNWDGTVFYWTGYASQWRNTGAITSIEIRAASGNLSGTMTIHGVN